MERNFKRGDRVIFNPADRTVYVYTGEGIEAPWGSFLEGNVYTIERRRKRKGLLLLGFYGFEGWFDSGAFDLADPEPEKIKSGWFRAVLPFAWEIAKIWIKNKIGGGSAPQPLPNFAVGGETSPSPAVYGETATINRRNESERLLPSLRAAGTSHRISRGVLKETKTFMIDESTNLPAGFTIRKEKADSISAPVAGIGLRIENGLLASPRNRGEHIAMQEFLSPFQNSLKMENEFGIEATKAGLTGLATVSRAVVGMDTNQDGNVDGMERAGAAAAIFPALFPLVTNFFTIRNETRKGELTPEEKAALLEHIIGLDVLPAGTRNDVIEEWIDDTIRAVLYNQRYIKNTLEVFRKQPEVLEAPEDFTVVVADSSAEVTGPDQEGPNGEA